MPEHAEPPPASRLDRVLVDRGLARSRGHARDLVAAGRVEVDGAVAGKVAQPVTPGQSVRMRPPEGDNRSGSRTSVPVGRGYAKLAHGLRGWPALAAAVAGARCLDAGASTGGFTQALLEHGADHVVALDVGRGQLADVLRADPRVVDRPGTNLRDVTPDELGGPFDVVVADLSFISLTLVLPILRALSRAPAQAVVLVKPQFEVGRENLSRSGVVRGAPDRVRAVTTVARSAVTAGWGVRDVLLSPLAGGSGNVEYLLWLGPPGPGGDDVDTVRSAVWAFEAAARPGRRSR